MPKVQIIPGKVSEEKKFDLSSWISKHSPIISFIAFLLTVLGFFWAIHTEISSLNSRVGTVEGKIEVILNDKKDMSNKNVQPIIIFITPSPTK